MKRNSAHHVAAGSAFGSVRVADGAPVSSSRRVSVRRSSIAFVAGFPGLIGALALLAAWSRDVPGDGAVPLGLGCMGLSAALLLLGLASRLTVDPQFVEVRFFGLRSSRVRFGDLASATFSMAFPSISFAITLRDRRGHRALIHANWWQHEPEIMAVVARGILEHPVPMDRTTARIVSQTLRVKRPKATIIHRGTLNRKRTW